MFVFFNVDLFIHSSQELLFLEAWLSPSFTGTRLWNPGLSETKTGEKVEVPPFLELKVHLSGRRPRLLVTVVKICSKTKQKIRNDDLVLRKNTPDLLLSVMNELQTGSLGDSQRNDSVRSSCSWTPMESAMRKLRDPSQVPLIVFVRHRGWSFEKKRAAGKFCLKFGHKKIFKIEKQKDNKDKKTRITNCGKKWKSCKTLIHFNQNYIIIDQTDKCEEHLCYAPTRLW